MVDRVVVRVARVRQAGHAVAVVEACSFEVSAVVLWLKVLSKTKAEVSPELSSET